VSDRSGKGETIVTERAAARGLRSARNRGRVVAVIAMGVLATVALSACRSEPGAAAFVGPTRITNAHISQVIKSVPAGSGLTGDDAKKLAIEDTTFNDLVAKLAKDKGYGSVTPDQAEISQIATQLKISTAAAASNEFIKLLAQTTAWEKLLVAKLPPVTPTDADLREVFDNLQKANVIQAGVTYEQAKSTIAGIQGIGTAFTVRDAVVAAAKKYDVSINPRWAAPCSTAPCSAVTIQLLPLQSSQDGTVVQGLSLNLDTDPSPAVLDPSSPAASPAAPAA
jgi:hypothetical protein